MDKTAQTSNHADGRQTALTQAIRRLMEPLVRLMLHLGLTYPQFIQIVRTIYIEQAIHREAGAASAPTDSRVSVMTGIARRYIKEMRESETHRVPAMKISPAATLIAKWTTLKEFSDESGKPRPLARLKKKNSEPSFETLAMLSSNDVRPRTLLDDLLDRQLVRLGEQDCVHLQANAYLPDQDKAELIGLFGEHIHDHLSTVANNLTNTEAPLFERSAYQGELSSHSIKAIQQQCDASGMNFLQDIYAQSEELRRQDAENEVPSNHHKRMRVGIYFFTEDDTPS